MRKTKIGVFLTGSAACVCALATFSGFAGDPPVREKADAPAPARQPAPPADNAAAEPKPRKPISLTDAAARPPIKQDKADKNDKAEKAEKPDPKATEQPIRA